MTFSVMKKTFSGLLPAQITSCAGDTLRHHSTPWFAEMEGHFVVVGTPGAGKSLDISDLASLAEEKTRSNARYTTVLNMDESFRVIGEGGE